MASKVVYSCDLCGAQKKESNHWWDIYVQDDNAISIYFLMIAPFSEEAPKARVTVCGQGCALKAVSQWLETRTLPFLKET